MIRTLLTTTALTAMLVTGAYAQDANPPATNPPADQTQPAQPPADQPPADQPAQPPADQQTPPPAGQTQPAQPAPSEQAAPATPVETYSAKPDDHMASKLIGLTVYDSTAQDAQTIGDVNDLVVDNDGKVVALVIGVGGFLGVGEKNVAIDYGKLEWSQADDGTQRLILETTKEALAAAPDFQPPTPPNQSASTPAVNNNAGAGAAGAAGAAAGGAAGAAGGAMSAATPNAPAANTPAAGSPPAATANAPAANANADQPEVDVASLKPVAPNSLKTDDLKGMEVINSEGQVIGSIGDFVLTDDGKVDAVIVDFGGFLGIGTKQVALGLDNLQFMGDQNNKHYLMADVSKDQLEKQAAYNKDDYQKNRDQQRLVVSSAKS